MKNILKIASPLRVMLVSASILWSSFLMSQPSCNVTITNNLQCDVELSIDMMELNASCQSCPGSTVSVTVLAGGSALISCTGAWSCTSSPCDISVDFIPPIGNGPFFYSNGPQPQTLMNLPMGCGAGVSPNIIFNAGSIDINP